MTLIADNAKIYVDTNIFIYLIEGHESFFRAANGFIRDCRSKAALLLTSELTVAECLYGAYKAQDRRKVDAYRELFSVSNIMQLLPLDRQVALDGARLGAPLGLKLIDGIHYASALRAGCDLFVSSDRRISRLPDIPVTRLAPWAR
jgi:predicted nucleic acid-binding protein